ncbi:MAG: AAC(3) family N-acetyltransferase [Anaerolineae bacterium]|nr:AAC(3) family N-acetyltransferase [Anaerolineae bacterium]
MSYKPFSQQKLRQQLRELGVISGDILLVHCAFSKVAPVEGGPLGLIAALQAAVGSEGTLVMPSMTDDDEHPFDPEQTPCLGMGVVANTFWQQPDVLRSDSPHAFAAKGPQAHFITAPHPIDVPHGLDSPVGRVYERNGQVLLLGVGHGTNTTIHLAESLAGVRYRRQKYLHILKAGQVTRCDYAEIDHCCERFNLVDGWLEADNLQRRRSVGYAEARLMQARDVVKVVMAHIKNDETVFLHPFGVDEECDEARASLTG